MNKNQAKTIADLEQALKGNEHLFDMEYWIDDGGRMCLASWIAKMYGQVDEFELQKQRELAGNDPFLAKCFDGECLDQYAIRALDLEDSEWEYVFQLQDWPKNFQNRYKIARGDVGRVKVAIEYLKWICDNPNWYSEQGPQD